MKNIYYLLFAGLLLASCKKDTGVQSTVGSLNIINAAIDATAIGVNFATPSLVWAQNTTQISTSSTMEFGLSSGGNQVNLISSADTTKPFYSDKISLISGGIYSLYAYGSAGSYGTLFVKDEIPIYPDSAAGARFINLSPNSQPLSVNLSGSTSKEYSNIAFKSITAFKKYSATSEVTNNGGYTFEVRDSAGNLLTTFNWMPQVFNKSNTLVITGLVGSASVSVFPVNNY